MAASSSVRGACQRCGAVFAEFYNAFTRVTGSYYMPSLVGSASTTGLVATGRTKSAAAHSELDGCDRQLFKLSNIILVSTATGLPAEPYIDEVRRRPPRPASNALTMEPDAIPQQQQQPPPPTHPEQQQQSQLPPTTKTPQNLPSRPVKIASKESTPAIAPKPAAAERMGPITSASPPNGHAVPNGHHAPPTPGEQALSAVRQLSEQVQWCVACCMEQNKHLERLDHTVHRLYQDVNGVSITVDKIKRDLQANLSNGRRPEDPMELEILQDAMSKMQSRVNELDTVKMQMDLFKSRLRRVEETTGAPNSASSVAQAPTSGSSASQHEPAPHHTPVPLTLTTPHHGERLPPPPSHFQPIEPRVEPRLESRMEARRELPRPELRAEPHAPPTYQSAYPPVSTQAPPMESERSSSGGWASINGPTSAKRVLPAESGVTETPADGSPKRQRVTSSDFRPSYPDGSGTYTSRAESNQETRRLSDPHSYPDSINGLTFVPYSSQDADPDDSWRPESQREQLDGRRRGRGGGRGRGRKILPHSNELGTPEWERPEWTGSQVSPDGFYQPITPDLVEARSGRSPLARRSSAGPPPSQTPSRMNTMDPYAHTKKSRTKPIRNADGILIRKDGRPDMRSQSSAANLRKVHARKEQQERGSAERRHTPTSGLATAPVMGTDGSADEEDGSASSGPTPTEERHAAIMGKIFPHGYEHRDRMDVAGQYFRKSSASPVERKMVPQAFDSQRVASEGHAADFRPVNASSAEKEEPRTEESEDGGMKRSFTQSTTESELTRPDKMMDGDGDSEAKDGFADTQTRIRNGGKIAPLKRGSPITETQMDTLDSAAPA
ncbi:MAG: hypothetical protein M1822_000018 [Bathelium mastoideum]|nr:MAG: hypothetical protein M1822_000018 [Bathelium mastoideum]